MNFFNIDFSVFSKKLFSTKELIEQIEQIWVGKMASSGNEHTTKGLQDYFFKVVLLVYFKWFKTVLW